MSTWPRALQDLCGSNGCRCFRAMNTWYFTIKFDEQAVKYTDWALPSFTSYQGYEASGGESPRRLRQTIHNHVSPILQRGRGFPFI